MRFLRGIKNKTRFDRIINEASKDELKVESIEVTIQWGHIAKMEQERLTRKVYEAKKKTERGKGKKIVKRRTEKGM